MQAEDRRGGCRKFRVSSFRSPIKRLSNLPFSQEFPISGPHTEKNENSEVGE